MVPSQRGASESNEGQSSWGGVKEAWRQVGGRRGGKRGVQHMAGTWVASGTRAANGARGWPGLLQQLPAANYAASCPPDPPPPPPVSAPGRWRPAAAASAGARTSRSRPGSWRTAGWEEPAVNLPTQKVSPSAQVDVAPAVPAPPQELGCLEAHTHTHLDRGVLGDDAGAGAGRIQQHAVHAALAQHARQLPAVVVAHHCAHRRWVGGH